MAIIEADISALKKIAGGKSVKLSPKELSDTISMMGLPVDKCDEETVFVEVSPNRPDCYCAQGLGRALESFLETKTGMRKYSVKKPSTTITIDSSVSLTNRPFVVAAIARKASLKGLLKSLIQLQEKLHDTIGRKRKKVAIGVHDLSKLKPPFYFKGVSPREASFVPLDMRQEKTLEEILLEHPKGIDYAHTLQGTQKYPLIVDSKNQVLSFPPIINGELTRASEETKDVLIEITGTSLDAQEHCLNNLCCVLADFGAQIEQVTTISQDGKKNYPSLEPKKMATSTFAAEKLLGLQFTQKQLCESLEKMGFNATPLPSKNNEVEALIPPYRYDIFHEVDLLEDAGIANGFEKLQGLPMRFATVGQQNPREAFAGKVRQLLIGLGFQDCITFMLTNEKKEYKKMQAQEQPRAEIANPLTEETTMLRTSLLPSLLSVLENNKSQKYPQKLFETGEVILLDEKSQTGARTVKKLCAISAHKDANLAEAKAALEAFYRELGEKPFISQKNAEDEKPFFMEGRSASIQTQSGKFKGFFGEIHPQVLENFGLTMPATAFELFLEE